MDNLTLSLQQNSSNPECDEPYKTIYFVLNSLLLFFGFPTTAIVIAKLLNKMYKTRSVSAGEVFLLQINVTNVCLFISYLLLFLNSLHVDYSYTLYVLFYSPTLTARPVFLLATSVIFYLAIAHPVTYMTTKTRLHWEWLVVTLVWSYALVVTLVIIFNKYGLFHPIYIAVFLISLPITMFFNITTLRALMSKRSRISGQTLNPVKRKAFRIILSIQVALLLYYVPRTFFFIHYYLIPSDRERFMCAEGPVIMMLPKISEFAMPVILLYSVQKLGV
ncbi:hypothetical protein Baya_11493 [Bagarius yarrelli]|uniref:G-protein coupled receptors family 1 profile domain-containing protein n=1 Tax=Bagarius yarrelli TaxID=175774 RepID=A0A556UZF6_BAGYA|nr:hypothetical protein Baya_11493 [Bagarius yarrelli]